MAGFLLGVGGCTPPPPVEPPPPLPDPDQLVRLLERRSSVHGSFRIVFRWDLEEPDLRASGRGVARIEGARVRIDLFSSRGEAVLNAALDGDSLRLPPGGGSFDPPPALLLRAAFGLFVRPGPTWTPQWASGSRSGDLRIRFVRATATPDSSEQWARVQVVLSPDRSLREISELEDGRPIRTVELDPGVRVPFPAGVVYRDRAAFRELRLTVESIDEAEAYPPEIWRPDLP